MSEGIEVQCGPPDRDGKQAVVATLGSRQHLDKFDPLSDYHRRRFREAVVNKFSLDDDAHGWLDEAIINAATAERERPQPEQLATPNITCLSAVTPKPVHWAWDQRIPAGAITLLIGDPNEGKSTLAIDIIARDSRGASMPPHDLPTGAAPASSLLLSAEDDLERTTLPRVLAAGGDPKRIHHLREVTPWNSATPRLVQIPTDVPLLENIIVQHRCRYMVVDVFSAFIAEGLNQNADSDMRACLSVLSGMAERTQVSVILLAHMNKKENSRGMYRAGGSVAIIGAARAAFAVGPNPDDPSEKVFAAVKHNLGPKPPSLTYRIEPAEGVSRIAWGGQTELSAADVLGAPQGQRGGSGGGQKVEQAKDIIQDILAAGPRGSNEVLQACVDAGLSERTYWTARKALGVRAEKTEFAGNWLLTMPANGVFHDEF